MRKLMGALILAVFGSRCSRCFWAAVAAVGVLGYRLLVTGSFHFSVPRRGKDAKFEKLMGALILAGLVQVCQDGQVVLWGGVAAAAARSGEFRTGEQVSARVGRGCRFLLGDRAITVASTRPLPAPLMRDIFTFQTVRASAMINEQRSKIKTSESAVRRRNNHLWFRRRGML